jgi:hypothetical protein
MQVPKLGGGLGGLVSSVVASDKIAKVGSPSPPRREIEAIAAFIALLTDCGRVWNLLGPIRVGIHLWRNRGEIVSRCHLHHQEEAVMEAPEGVSLSLLMKLKKTSQNVVKKVRTDAIQVPPSAGPIVPPTSPRKGPSALPNMRPMPSPLLPCE